MTSVYDCELCTSDRSHLKPENALSKPETSLYWVIISPLQVTFSTMPRCAVAYVVSNELAKVSSLLPSNKGRSLLVHSLVKEFGLLSPNDEGQLLLLRPVPATLNDLSVYHTRDYLDFILDPKNVTKSDFNASVSEFGLEEDCPLFPGLPDYVRLVAGASLTAANALLQGQADIAINWDGGRHHAQKSHAAGFCYVADCVLSILAIKKTRIPLSMSDGHRKPRIMYLDLDLHFSDAVSQSFHSSASISGTPQILTFSIHHASPGFFPVSALASLPDPSDPSFDPFTLSLPLARGASNATFAKIWTCVEGVKDTFQPDYVVVQCGVDGLAGDPCAVFNWSLGGGEGSLGWCIDRICHQWKCKTLLLGGGGYNSPNAARAWTYLTSIVLGRPLSLDADIPDHSAFPLYAPSFTLDVPAGNIQDRNTETYLSEVQDRFEKVCQSIHQRLGISP